MGGGALTGAAIAYWKRSYIYLLLGPLGGYVACAVAFDVYKPWQTLLVAMGAPIVCYAVYEFSQARRWDEHKLTPLFLGAGSYGLIMVGLVSWGTEKGGYFGLTEGDYAFQNAEINLLWQVIGLVVIVGAGVVTAWVLAFILERTIGLRLSEEEQVAGVDAGDWDLVGDLGRRPATACRRRRRLPRIRRDPAGVGVVERQRHGPAHVAARARRLLASRTPQRRCPQSNSGDSAPHPLRRRRSRHPRPLDGVPPREGARVARPRLRRGRPRPRQGAAGRRARPGSRAASCGTTTSSPR